MKFSDLSMSLVFSVMDDFSRKYNIADFVDNEIISYQEGKSNLILLCHFLAVYNYK
jgi:hypothetical protein